MGLAGFITDSVNRSKENQDLRQSNLGKRKKYDRSYLSHEKYNEFDLKHENSLSQEEFNEIKIRIRNQLKNEQRAIFLKTIITFVLILIIGTILIWYKLM